MLNPLSRYIVLAKRWGWLVVLGVVFCSGVTYVLSEFISPVYQASAFIVISIKVSATGNDDFTASELAVPTYAQLITSPSVLNPVLAQHPGLTLKGLRAIVTVKPLSNTKLIEVDVVNGDPQVAEQFANEIAQSLAHFANSQSPGIIQILPAEVPLDPVFPKPLSNAALGAVVGLGLALALIITFEWLDDRLARPEEVTELLGTEILTVIPRLSAKQRNKMSVETPASAERYRILSASLNAEQTIRPFKLIMVTSAVANEGKTTVAANTASCLAMAGKQVLLIDANLHHPMLDQLFQLDNHMGLSSIFLEMSTQSKVELYGQATSIPTLRVLTAGKLLARPSDMLQSMLAQQLFDFYKHVPFDYVIFDTPPLLPVADAQILTSLVQAIILVVDANKTPRRVLSRLRRILNRTGTMVLGVAINKSPWAESGNTRQYANHKQQVKTDAIMTMSPGTLPRPSMVNPADTSRFVPRQVQQFRSNVPIVVEPTDTSRSLKPLAVPTNGRTNSNGMRNPNATVIYGRQQWDGS